MQRLVYMSCVSLGDPVMTMTDTAPVMTGVMMTDIL